MKCSCGICVCVSRLTKVVELHGHFLPATSIDRQVVFEAIDNIATSLKFANSKLHRSMNRQVAVWTRWEKRAWACLDTASQSKFPAAKLLLMFVGSMCFGLASMEANSLSRRIRALKPEISRSAWRSVIREYELARQ